MDPVALVAVGGGVLLLIIVVAIYNGLVGLRNHIRESWADIDVQMKRRYDLIPNLVETVKGYAKHEKETFAAVVEARNRAFGNNGRYAEQAQDENRMLDALKRVLVVAEGYPELKANQNFLKLQQELVDTEDKIAAARRFFNGNVRDYNNRTQMFPSSIIAGTFGFRPEEYFEVEDDAVRKSVTVAL
ncbi:MAG: hypothetical protein A2Z34_11530 [Planctomycetes bacterium RBG_16_59_8]|nr:MAG: hypothetical protein A2Z34_11530 [Planctomycetes bacterium RBG_16_59_8]